MPAEKMRPGSDTHAAQSELAESLPQLSRLVWLLATGLSCKPRTRALTQVSRMTSPRGFSLDNRTISTVLVLVE